MRLLVEKWKMHTFFCLLFEKNMFMNFLLINDIRIKAYL